MSSKQTIVILHGWAYSTDKWQPLVKLLSSSLQVKLLKVPGLTEDLHEVWNLDDYVAWLDTKIKKDKPVILLGHSNGGRISLSYTAQFPKKVVKLILIDSAGLRDRSLKAVVKRNLFGTAAKIGKKIIPRAGARKLLYRLAREKDYEQANETLKQTMSNLISVDLRSILATIATETLIIWGEQDTVTPLKDAHLLNKKIAHSKLTIIKNARHSPMFTHTNQVYKAVIDFI